MISISSEVFIIMSLLITIQGYYILFLEIDHFFLFLVEFQDDIEKHNYSTIWLLSILGDLFDGVDFTYNDEGRFINVVGVPYGNRSVVLSYYPNGKIKRITNTEKGTVDFYWTD